MSKREITKLSDLKDNEILIKNPFEAISLDCLDLHHRIKNKYYNQSTIKELYKLKDEITYVCNWNIPQIKKVILRKLKKNSDKKN